MILILKANSGAVQRYKTNTRLACQWFLRTHDRTSWYAEVASRQKNPLLLERWIIGSVTFLWPGQYVL